MPDDNITIRLLGPADHDVLRRVHDDVFDHAIREDSLARFLADPRHVMAVALDGETVVGMCSAFEYFHPDKPPHMFLNEIGVAPPYQRRGLGKRLTTAILEEAKRRNCTFVWVGTETNNVAAQRLFESVGDPEKPQTFLLYEWDREK